MAQHGLMNKLNIIKAINIKKGYAALLLAFFLLSYILPLGARDLVVPDETRYAEIPREMIAGGDWVVPNLNGLRYFEKPALGYWVHAGSLLLFGENNFAVRLPSALAVGLSALLIAVPGAVIAIHSFGDFLGWHPHLHVLCTDGCFYGNGMFRVAPLFELKHLEAIFRHKVFKMLISKGKITKDLVDMLMKWRHSGFNVFCGSRIQPGDEKAMENLARYIIRASFSQERMTYIAEESKVIYRSKDGKEERVFDALEWLAAMCSHVPNKGEQMVRYYA